MIWFIILIKLPNCLLEHRHLPMITISSVIQALLMLSANAIFIISPLYSFETLKLSHYPVTDQNIRKNSFQDEHDGVEYSFPFTPMILSSWNSSTILSLKKARYLKIKITVLREQMVAEYLIILISKWQKILII